MDQIRYPLLKILVFMICFVFYRYCILVFDLLHRVLDIQIFLVPIETDKEPDQNL